MKHTYNDLLKKCLFAGVLLILQIFSVYGSRIHDIRLDRYYGAPLAQTDSLYPVHGQLTYIGSGMLESLYMHYQVGDGEVRTTLFDEININAQIPFFYSADEYWIPEHPGDYELTLWFSGLNGAPEEEGVSDTLAVVVSVYDYLPERDLVLLESFSSQNCGSCAIVNPQIRALVNENPDYSMIFYHPLAYENSPIYNFNHRDHDIRRDFYGVNFTPLSAIGGLFYGSTEWVDEDLLDLEWIKPAAFAFEATYHIEDEVIHAQVEATAYADFHDHDLRLLISLTEDEVHFDEPPGHNGEDSFYHVMRAFLPDAGGFPMEPLDKGDVFTASAQYHLEQGYVDTTQVRLHAFIQDLNDKEIYQVSRLVYQVPDDDNGGDDNGDDDNGDDDNGDDDNGDDDNGDDDNGDDDNGDDDNGDNNGEDNGDDDNGDETSVRNPHSGVGVTIYPNPARQQLSVLVDNGKAVDNIRIFDLRGREVLHKSTYKHGIDTVFRLYVNTLDPGLYIMKLETASGVLQEKFTIFR